MLSNSSGIYQERDDFILIGLTGWTGSGCSTAANILRNEKFPKIRMPDINLLDGNEKRKALIVHNYISKNWTPFFCIKVSAILTVIMLEMERDVLLNFLNGFGFENYQHLNELFHEHDAIVYSEMDVLDFYEEAARVNAKIQSAIGLDDYTVLYQCVGNLVRSGAVPFEKSDCVPIQIIPRKIVSIVECHKKLKPGKNYYVIDAIRNPFEAVYLKDRFSAFYLVGVTVDNDVRRARLFKKGMEYFDVAVMDVKEGVSLKDIDISQDEKLRISNLVKDDRDNKICLQNISACLEKCDIYLENPDDPIFSPDYDNPAELAKGLATYVSLMQRPGLITPTAIERVMQIAVTAKLNSGCLSRQVGAVVTDEDYAVLSIGWNDVAKGQVSCLLRNAQYYVRGNDPEAFSDYELRNVAFREAVKIKVDVVSANKTNGRVFSYCFKDVYNDLTKQKNQVHTRALHAEENAFLQLAKRGGAVSGGYLFTTASPCELCSKKSYQMGVRKIYYVDPYPGIATSNILESGAARPELELFKGAIGRAYHQLYHSVMPYKDEMELLLK
ncbi:hypothetical protein [Vogesella indigofera]|uniref:hypothetical protein n=1 Tax=Vogesella indigofera TaxID=45465 RepID=UPI00234EE4B6|nr:hypothetical protein [Vogesella indigofera]MDC7699989.1 hypothetical protein [Vogesella indigofera]